jgi:hypothetical protein
MHRAARTIRPLVHYYIEKPQLSLLIMLSVISVACNLGCTGLSMLPVSFIPELAACMIILLHFPEGNTAS